ncbi:hypothetical protein GCM10010250_36230 [Streptomyces althioticus]|nr:hypothetical protein GCM10010250_36230 [Streptomyces althioticus]
MLWPRGCQRNAARAGAPCEAPPEPQAPNCNRRALQRCRLRPPVPPPRHDCPQTAAPRRGAGNCATNPNGPHPAYDMAKPS